MKGLKKKAVAIFNQYGSVIIFTSAGEHKVLHTRKDIDFAFKLAMNGIIEEIVEAR